MASSSGTTDDFTDKIRIYGADWCPDCRYIKTLLTNQGIDFEYIVLGEEEDETRAAAERVSGQKHIPVVIFPDGVFYVEPTKIELGLKLKALGLTD